MNDWSVSISGLGFDSRQVQLGLGKKESTMGYGLRSLMALAVALSMGQSSAVVKANQGRRKGVRCMGRWAGSGRKHR